MGTRPDAGRDESDLQVYYLDGWAWEARLAVRVVASATLADFVALVEALNWPVRMLSYDGLVADGVAAGGQVLAVETAGGRQYVAAGPAALAALEVVLEPAEYVALCAGTPGLGAPRGCGRAAARVR